MSEKNQTSHDASFDERLKKVEADTEKILTTVIELKLGVCGSEQIGIEGMLQKVKRHEEYIENDKKSKYRFAGGIAVLTFIITITISLLAIYVEAKK
jgi:hypothetical protein